MKGLELSRSYYETYGKPMLEEQFSEVLPLLAVGLVGSGSERFGFDDDISTDHDFEPGFCIFIPDEDKLDRRNAFLLERAYAKLPKEHFGFRRQNISPVGGARSGVILTSEFYTRAVGSPTGDLTSEEWLRLPDYSLAEATNGEVFFDNLGEFSSIRQKLSAMPEDVRLKKLAGNLLLMAQSGQYNFSRCIGHGEEDAAQLAANEFVGAAMRAFFLLKRVYMPYYKWSFRALRASEDGEKLAQKLSVLLAGDNRDPLTVVTKMDTVEEVAVMTIDLLQSQNLTEAICGDLEKHAYSVNDRVEDSRLRNLHVLAGV